MTSAFPTPALSLTASRQFTAWLAAQTASIAFTTYQAGKVFFIGLQPDGSLSVFERTFERCMGLAIAGNSLYMSSLYQLWRFENVLLPGQKYQGYDALYVPQFSLITGDLDIHDIVIPANQHSAEQTPTPIFVNTLFSCLATTSKTHNFKPLWQPPFISKLAAEDRCHLNGLAIREGQPRYVTTVSRSDMGEGWRDRRLDGGCVIDVQSNEIIASGLSMPHSPRWYQDRLWVLNSGCGEFGYVDLQTGDFQPVAFCPGYLRGCAFVGDFAIIGISKPRNNQTFSGLPLDDLLIEKDAEPRCGLLVIDLNTGDVVHSLRIEGVVEELYDVQVLENIRRPMAIGIRSDEIRRFIRVDDTPRV
ncbi:TIGR03032 family protein [Oscillatoria sp. CS-180]|uniref:TIGR03032 family protein n=1 Tax=Oscillatoria sp. CS-180 TaxID=3021720 RepID=UPI00232AB7C1|nr:TIGR03032 family protein [Oscillatoria sp. CS-180]MDB9527896.1 TIGR03032 family protein [Oscillatoria sp. CS-180]